MHADLLHHTHLVHTSLAHLHTGMVDTLVCTQRKSHGMQVMTALDRLHALHPQPPFVHYFAEHSRELSRVSQVPFSCASFWQGLCFAVQMQNSAVIQRAMALNALRQQVLFDGA